jgi:hypothetical protein
MRSSLLLVGLVFLILTGLVLGGAAQQQEVMATLEITNICKEDLTISAITFTKDFMPIFTQLIIPPASIPPRGTRTFGPYELKTTPNDLTLKGYLAGRPFSITIMPLLPNTPYTYKEQCLQVIAYFEVEVPPQPEVKPYREGMSLEDVKTTLLAKGISIREKGTQAEPGFNFDPDDPMLIGALAPFSATLMFVTSPGTLRAVLTWDNPTVDLDLIIFGIGGTWCWQIAPAGILAELCDRPPQAPVWSPMGVFAVFIINLSPSFQAYVLTWSS